MQHHTELPNFGAQVWLSQQHWTNSIILYFLPFLILICSVPQLTVASETSCCSCLSFCRSEENTFQLFFFFSNKTQFECNQTTCPSALKCSQWDIICSLLQCVFGNIYSFWLWSSSHYTICVRSSSFTANNVFPLLHHAAVVLSLELLNWV